MFRVQLSPARVKRYAVILLIFAGALALGYYLIPGKPDVPPRDAMAQALQKTSGMQSYEYNIKMTTLVDGKKQLASSVKGERQDGSHIHIKGRMFDSEMDFYQLGPITYTKDQLSGEWIKITDNQINQQEIFLFELNPLASFAYKELKDAKLLGSEEINGRKCWVYGASPVINNPYMEILWQDFKYKFWVDARSFLIYKAEVTAVSKNNPAGKMNLLVEISNYGKAIELKPPK